MHPVKRIPAGRKQKELEADKDVNGRLVWGERKRVDLKGDKQLKKQKNGDKKHKWKHKNALTPRPFCRLQTKVRFFGEIAAITSRQSFPAN